MLKPGDKQPRRYQDEVPAVVRAVRALELLAGSSSGQTLAELSRALDISASSLLAILTTLRRSGLVARDDRGSYRVGPRLAGLGAAASQGAGLFERFEAMADALVGRFGETVLLWVRQDGGYALAGAREGTLPLRYVPSPGAWCPAGETRLGLLEHDAEIVEQELAPGVWTVAVALPCPRDACFAALALAGPRDRLAAPALRSALVALVEPLADPRSTPRAADAVGAGAALRDSPDSDGAGPGTQAATAWELAGPIDADELDGFLRQSLVATLSYLADDGYPATVPLWYAWAGGAFWLAPRPGSEWAEHVKLAPRVSLAVSESTLPLRRVLARGQLVEVNDPSGEHWSAIEAQLAARYAGFDAAREPLVGGRGRLLRLEPEHLIAWRGLLRHPNLPPLPDASGTVPWRHLG